MKKILLIVSAVAIISCSKDSNPDSSDNSYLHISWEKVPGHLPSDTIFSVAVHPSGVLLTTTDRGMYRSTDNGAAWERVGGLDDDHLYLHVAQDGTLFVITYTAFGSRVGYSKDIGKTWSYGESFSRDTAYLQRTLATNSSGALFVSIDVHDGNYSSIMESTDNGESWNATRLTLRNNIGTILFCNNSLYVTCTGHPIDSSHIYRSTNDGLSWEVIRRGISNGNPHAMIADASERIFVGADHDGDNSGIYRSTDHGTSFSQISLRDSSITLLATSSNNSLFCVCSYHYNGFYNKYNIYYSSDGISWTQSNTGLPDSYISSLAANTSNGITFIGTWQGLYRTIH